MQDLGCSLRDTGDGCSVATSCSCGCEERGTGQIKPLAIHSRCVGYTIKGCLCVASVCVCVCVCVHVCVHVFFGGGGGGMTFNMQYTGEMTLCPQHN